MNMLLLAWKNLWNHWRFHICTGVLLFVCYVLLVVGVGLTNGAADSSVQNMADMFGGYFVVSAYTPENPHSNISRELEAQIDAVMKERFPLNYIGFDRIYEGNARVVNMTTMVNAVLPDFLGEADTLAGGSFVQTLEDVGQAKSSGTSTRKTMPARVGGPKSFNVTLVSDSLIPDNIVQCTPNVLLNISMSNGDILMLTNKGSAELKIEMDAPYLLVSPFSVKTSPATARKVLGMQDESYCSELSLLFKWAPPYANVVRALETIAPVSEKGYFKTLPINRVETISMDGIRFMMPDVRAGLDGSLKFTTDNFARFFRNVNEVLEIQRQLSLAGFLLFGLVALSVFVTMYISLDLRCGELATCRIIGARKSRVFWIVAQEHLILSSIVLFLGVFAQIGAALYFKATVFPSDMYVQLLGREGHYIFSPPWWLPLVCGTAILVIPLLGTLPVLLPLLRKSPVQALAEAG